VLAMFGSIAVTAFLPWLDTSKVRSGRFRPLFKIAFWLFVVTVLFLGYLGSQPAEGNATLYAQICTAYYFAFFLIILPALGFIEKPKALPNSIIEDVLAKSKH
jgi:quinol-cytochrome oxidoreductase complex cytochrome b subunit